jgi:hypothetical protein
MPMNESRRKPELNVYCRRLQQELPVSEHADCPYCFGSKDQITDGVHRGFCGFDPEKDPIQFGFRPDSERFTRG